MRGRLALLAALVAALAYAAFAAGAARQPGEALLEVALAVLALVAVAALLYDERWRARAPRPAWIAVGALAAFAAWSGITLAWSIAPDRSWEELNRALAYALVAGLGVLLGAALPRAVERFAAGWLGVAVAVALYALGGKVAPGVHVGGLLDLDHTAQISRLRAPLEYWNALGLLCALAVPVAVRIATDAGRSLRARLAALEAAYLLVIVIGLTYSRGAVVALAVAAAVLTLAGGARLRGLVVLIAAGLAAAVPLAFAFSRAALKTNGAPLDARIADGRLLGAIVVAAALALLGLGALLTRREARIAWSAAGTRRLLRVAAVGAGVVAVALAAGLARSQQGLRGSVERAVAGFTETRQDRQYDPARLLTTNSSNRYEWWREAAGAWSDRPLTGWGAGSFATLHLLYRRDTLPVTQAHSVPLQMLAETGLVGLALGYGAVLALLAAAVAGLRRLPAGRERDLSAAFVAAGVAWLVHGAFDWDWNIPAVTAPALAMLGLAAGRAGSAPRAGAPGERGPGARAALVALATVGAAAAAASALAPWLAQARADDAAAQAGVGTPAALEQAAATADLAARLDPLSPRGLFVSAVVAGARGRLLDARRDLLEAADRQPDDPEAWVRLALLGLRLADREGALRAAQRALALDPRNPYTAGLVRRVLAFLAPPGGSATATGTPLAPAPPPGAP